MELKIYVSFVNKSADFASFCATVWGLSNGSNYDDGDNYIKNDEDDGNNYHDNDDSNEDNIVNVT